MRVPSLPEAAAEVVRAVGAVMATSANLHGGPDPRRLDEVPEEIRAACGALVDGGELPGVPSTVLDLTGPSRGCSARAPCRPPRRWLVRAGCASGIRA